MKKLLTLASIALLASCSAPLKTITAKVTETHIDDLRRSKSYLVLDTSDTLICLDKAHKYEIGKEYVIEYQDGFRKMLK